MYITNMTFPFLPIVTMFRNVALFLVVNIYLRWKFGYWQTIISQAPNPGWSFLQVHLFILLYAAKNTHFHPIPDLCLLSVYLFSVPICGHPYVTSVGTQSHYVVSVGLVGKWHSVCRVWLGFTFHSFTFSVRECEKHHVPRAKTRSSNLIFLHWQENITV